MDFFLARQLRERHATACRVSANRAAEIRALIEPFDLLFETDGPRYDLPEDLEKIYGRLGFADRVVYSNFVSSLDGVVTLGDVASAGSIISGRNQADRFLMGLLRACADAVLLGAGTLRATPGHHWTAEHIYPAMAASFARLRSKLGRKAQPRLVLFTASGNVDITHPAVVGGATIVTTRSGAARLNGRLPQSCDVMEIGDSGDVDSRAAIDQLRSKGYDVLLTEGGPHLTADFIEHKVLDEAFITVSPVIAGRDKEARHGMVAGVELLPSHQVWSELLSVRRHDDFLFLRYDLRNSARP
ncbi:MAG TPA: dihydrofolate reductase family protein [Candidatus Dormibacteraeota bacterium]|nr:dihydrofolate reductase family protein [Candidatus Dormibacteraeota bacterium]